ncbi:hypothetical protein QBC34DRAFT_401251 [Podospora aff. communis PSN243]|uniref:Zn(2)-C6 fungal-type domain-containing protein n=1 Tax=Podospora aff. communis PSN243 TaxID=3040156 RepID=A0AAV9GVU0_9PEZI|nr:hypothetical protein QBC34DRAFT_401251 [Podospora aff. communis PSN243]
MRQSLRRSCWKCAKSKLACDLATPRCSRCAKTGARCVYANEPLTAKSSPTTSGGPSTLTIYSPASMDPFDSYPSTRLPRHHVQRLIHSFLNKIAFQYYPLDLNKTSNPFLVSWWPLALGDPALFHVTLQTACLDEELIAQQGFTTSELLMSDSVALLRRKVQDSALAIQDGTMNSVITLATIEFGKGNKMLAEMHVEGVKKLVSLRGGIGAVRQTSPLTARMISWVSLLIMGSPQFQTQDDVGIGDGIPPSPEWLKINSAVYYDGLPQLLDCDAVDPAVLNVFARLRMILRQAQQMPLSSTRLHDLTSFVIHRLLLSAPDTEDSSTSPTSESLRYAITLFMFLVQGPTYYSHAVIFIENVRRLTLHLNRIDSTPRAHGFLSVWLYGVGMAAAAGTTYYERLVERAGNVSGLLHVADGDEAMAHVKNVLWLATPHADGIYRRHWDAALSMGGGSQASTPLPPRGALLGDDLGEAS